ncbi:condensation domain-containing protein [Actinomadura luteofluorescens]|uniref:condensation domain-containing protein n=1 Tax=Actinomadura luteofluorescens TaxID=46163 RepID=UPI003D8B52EF
MRPDQIERICRLTPLQDGMFFEALRKQDSGETIYQLCLRLEGALSPSLLRESWRAVLRRHPILRTSFHYERLDLPVQVVSRDADPEWRESDWRGTPAEEIEQRLEAMLAEDRTRPFELGRAPLMRLAVIRVADDAWWLIWSYHHLLLDGWSTYLVLDDVFGWYRELAAGRLPERRIPRPFWEYVAWTQRQDLGKAERFWRDRLAGFTSPTPIGEGAVDPPAGNGPEFDEVHATVPTEVFAGLEALARTRRLTLGTVVQAAWALTLSRYSRREDVVFGSVVSGRPPEFAGVDDMVGLFINVLPVRARVAGDVSLADWLTGLQAQLADGREYDYSPLAHVQRWSEVPRGSALFESLVVYINYPVRPSWTDGGTVKVADLRVIQQPHYPLHLTAVPDQGRLRMVLGYDPARFGRGTVERVRDLVVEILTIAATDPERRVGELPGWPEPDGRPAADDAGTVAASGWSLDRLTGQCLRTPDAPAVVCGDLTLTYGELDRRAERVAGELRRSGAGTVAVVLGPSPALPVSLLAVVKAGGTILPLDPDDGDERISAAMAATGAAVALCDGSLADRLAATDRLTVGDDLHFLRLGAEPRAGQPGAESDSRSTPAEDGSDAPSGTRWAVSEHDAQGATTTSIRYDALAKLLHWMGEHFPLSAGDRVAHLRPPGSAESVRDIFWTMSSGAALVLSPPAPRPSAGASPAVLEESLVENEVTVAVVPGSPAVAPVLGRCRSLRLVFVPGPLPTASRLELTQVTGADLVEEYRFPHPVPQSSFWHAGTGELVAAPVAARRRGHPRVLPSAADADAPMPATKSSARHWAVEAALAGHPGVRDTAVTVAAGPSGEQRLTAYVVPAGDSAHGMPDASELEAFLALRLPARLVPATFVPLTAMPTARDGQPDLAALPAPEADAGPEAVPVASPTAVTAEVLTGIWAQVFDRAPALDEDFFDLGGHSLLAIKLVSRIRSALGVDFTLNDLFGDPTVIGTARAVMAALRSGDTLEPERAIPKRERTGPVPASFAQERLWILDRLGGAARHDNILLPCRLRGPVDVPAFRAALTALMERHEVLRTCLGEMDGRPVQVVHGSVETPLAVSDLSSLPLPEAERGARAMLEDDSAQRFDLSAAPLFKVRVVRLAEDDHVIGICLHHVAIDGWSTGVLFRDLGELYQACATGRAAALPPLTAQYADFATWQRGRLTGEPLDELLGYWTEALRDAPEMLELQPGRPRPAERSYKGGRFDVDLTPDVLRTVRELARQEGGTLFMVLFAAFAVLVARRAGRRDFVIGVPVAGRSHPDLENLVGFFVNTLPERLDLSGEPTFRGLVHHVRRVHLGALAHEDLPFERLVGELGPDRATDRLPLVQVAFNFQNAPFAPLRFGEVEATLFETDHEVARFDMVAELYEHQDGVHCMFHYSADLFEPAYVRQFADEYLDLVRRLAAEPDGPVFAAADGAVDVPAQVRQALDTSSLSRLRALQGQG